MKISLYILNFNYGNYIEKAIQSVLNQTVLPNEILIIDDGSTDNSRNIIETYRNNSNIQIILQENIGMLQSCNVALAKTKGDYIIRLDADDMLEPNAIESLALFAKEYPIADWIFPGFYYTDEKGVKLKPENRGTTPFFISANDKPPHGACSIIKRSTLESFGGYSKNVNCRDGLDLFLKLKNKKTILSIPNYLFSYRRHDMNLTLNKKMLEESETILRASNNNLI